MSKLKITQVRSSIKCLPRQKATLKALGIKKMHQSVELKQSPQIDGMLKAVGHLVKVEKA